MKKIILSFITVCLISGINYSQKKPKIKGNKIITEVIKEITEDFNSIEIDDALEVSILQSGINKYHLKTDANLVDIIQFTVKDSVLKIYTSNRIVSSKKLEISLDIKEVNNIVLKNDAKIEGKKRLISKKMNISGYNSSQVDLDVNAENVVVNMQDNAGGKLKIRSTNTSVTMNNNADLKAYIMADITKVSLAKSAKLMLDGDSNYATYNLKDSSKLDAKKMKVSTVDAYTSNTSDIDVHATRNLELYAEDKSNVYVYGNPKMDVKGMTDKSKIIKR